MLALGLAGWELAVRIGGIPPYVLPAPGLILQTLVADWALLSQSLLVTLDHDSSKVFCSPLPAASALRCCSTSRGWSNIRSIPTR